MSESELQIHTFDSSRFSERLEVFQDAFPENRGTSIETENHYQWKFKRFPSVPPSYEYEARSGAHMIGYYGAIPFSYSIHGNILRAGMVCDVMTHSRARGKGVFTRIGRFALEDMRQRGVDFTTGYPIRPEVIPGHLKVGWKIAFELPMYFRFFRADGIMQSKGVGFLAMLVNPILSILRVSVDILTSRPETGAVAQIRSLEETLSNPKLDTLVRKWAARYPNHLVKSPEFYRWRLSAPSLEYKIGVTEVGDEWRAMAVLRKVSLQGIKCLAVLDFISDGDAGSETTLLRKISKWAREQKCEAVTLMMSTHNAREHRLAKFGYLRSPFTFKLIIRTLSERVREEHLLKEGAWHLMWIDSDDL